MIKGGTGRNGITKIELGFNCLIHMVALLEYNTLVWYVINSNEFTLVGNTLTSV